jgi:hypothetical protein
MGYPEFVAKVRGRYIEGDDYADIGLSGYGDYPDAI